MTLNISPTTNSPSLDSISKHFDLSFNISNPSDNYEYSIFRNHPKFYEYNVDIVKNVQNKRREEFLQNLKRKREKTTAKMRGLVEPESMPICYNIDEFFEQNNYSTNPICKDTVEESAMDTSTESGTGTKENSKKSQNDLKNQQRKDMRKLISDKFMLSEWLVDIPDDFFQNWFMMCCPKGRRTMVIASNGQTKVYTRSGYFLFQFNSFLPGGSHRSPNSLSKYSMLDCIFVESEQMFYILDVIVWNSHSFYDCDTEFRFYWIHSHIGEDLINEQSNSQIINESNVEMCDNNAVSMKYSYKFCPLEYWPCTMDNIKLRANGPYPFKTSIDGILFYHKEAPYTVGVTPLVCWLKVKMIPKLFNISLENSMD